jgi:DNA helicase IV
VVKGSSRKLSAEEVSNSERQIQERLVDIAKDNDVRVFDVQHIKGLEFEAVFFVGIDKLAARHPLLFDKYLYVGATRAATYLGLTCASVELPSKIKPLEDSFAASWR